MKLLDEIHKYLKDLGCQEETIQFFDSSSVYVAQEIALYAHRNQWRLNGSNYYSHPCRVLQKYRDFVGIKEDDYFCLNIDLLVEECEIPYHGVQEVCLLHDVLEDTEITMEQIEEVFHDLSIGTFFTMYIKNALSLITHDKSEGYVLYIKKLLRCPTASLVKFMDLADNMDPSTLNVLENKETERLCKYAQYAKMINDKWRFLENREKYFNLYKSKINN